MNRTESAGAALFCRWRPYRDLEPAEELRGIVDHSSLHHAVDTPDVAGVLQRVRVDSFSRPSMRAALIVAARSDASGVVTRGEATAKLGHVF
jgi:hypothetical protein